jgi:hypothetical protein
MVVRRMFGPKRDEVTGGWRKLYNEIHNLYSSPNIVRMINSRRMRCVGHAVCMGKMRNAFKFWWESLKGIDHLEDLGIDGRMLNGS